MTFDEWVQPRLQTDAEEAAGVLRLALADADTDPRTLLLTVDAIIAARGGFDDLGLTGAETLVLSNVLARRVRELSAHAA